MFIPTNVNYNTLFCAVHDVKRNLKSSHKIFPSLGQFTKIQVNVSFHIFLTKVVGVISSIYLGRFIDVKTPSMTTDTVTFRA